MNAGPLEHVPGKREDLSYRNDLSNAIGIFLRRPDPGNETGEFFEYLETITGEIGAEHATLPPLDRTVPAHAYEIPPAAGTWSDIAVLLWENGKPILENVSMITAAAHGIQWVITHVKKWKTARHDETVKHLQEIGAPITPPEEDLRFFLSQGAVSVLVVADFVEQYGYQEDLGISTFPRGIHGYNDPDHPNGSINYLVECRFADRLLVYVVDSRAKVSEHFEVRESHILPLPLLDLSQ